MVDDSSFRSFGPLLIALILSLPLATSSNAAEISESSSRNCAIKLEGPVVRGDFDRLTELLRSRGPVNKLNQRTFSICLSSQGGSFDEGLKIAEFVSKQGLTTVVEYGSDCFSSCAIIFMSGAMHDQIAPSRQLSVGGRLGFHAPYLNVADRKYSKEEMEQSSRGTANAILALVRLSAKKMKLGAEFIKKSLIQRLLEKGQDEVFFIKTIFDAARWDIELLDADQHYPINDASVQGISNMCANFHFANMDHPASNDVGYSVHVEDFSSRYQAKDFRILVRNSRTRDVICEFYPKENGKKKTTFTGCSHDYWSSRTFGDCRDYETRPSVLIGKYVPSYFALAPETLLKRYSN